jgi:hypothetical protein
MKVCKIWTKSPFGKGQEYPGKLGKPCVGWGTLSPEGIYHFLVENL